jgi:hypothetical protein
MTSRLRLLLLGLAAVVAVALVAAAACGDDDDDDGGASSAQIEQALLDAQRAQVLATMNSFRIEQLHEIDEAAQEASEFEAGWEGSLERLHGAVIGVDWPDDLAEDAAGLAAALAEAEDAIVAEDLAAFKTAITNVHGLWHDFDHAAYAFISGEEHAEGEEDDHGEEGEATDEASATEAGG